MDISKTTQHIHKALRSSPPRIQISKRKYSIRKGVYPTLNPPNPTRKRSVKKQKLMQCLVMKKKNHNTIKAHWSSSIQDSSPNPHEIKTRALIGQVTEHCNANHCSLAYIALFQKIHTLRREYIQKTPSHNFAHYDNLPTPIVERWHTSNNKY
jgi:hypothetical protein